MPTKLSQILEENADPKYRLSAKACQGILNRAERRGKELPKELKEALEEQVAANNGSQEIRDGARLEMDGTEILPPEPSASRNAQENLGGAKESLSRVNTLEPCQRSITSQSCSVDVYNQTVEKSDISGTVTAEVGVPNHSGPKVMTTASFMGGQGSKAGGLGYREEVSPSLKSESSGTNTVPDIVQAVHQNASGEVRESDVPYTVGTNQNASGRNTPLVRSVDCRNGNETEELNSTLQAKPNGGYSLNMGGGVRVTENE